MKPCLIITLIGLLFVGCVTKTITTTTTNYDQAGTILVQRNEKVKVRGVLATSKTTGLQGEITWDNRWATNETGTVLTNGLKTAITLAIASTSFDVSTNAAAVLEAPAKSIEALGEAAKAVKAPPGL